MEWLSFYLNALPLVTDFCEDIQGISIRHQLNRSQTRALKKLKDASEQEFQRVNENNLKDLIAREIEDIAVKAVKRENHEKSAWGNGYQRQEIGLKSLFHGGPLCFSFLFLYSLL